VLCIKHVKYVLLLSSIYVQLIINIGTDFLELFENVTGVWFLRRSV